MSGLHRLHLISQIDPVYASIIFEFLELHPNFKPYLPIAALSLSRISIPGIKNLKNVRQVILYYISHTLVKASLGLATYHRIKDCQTSAECPELKGIPMTKIVYLKQALDLPHDFTLEQFKTTKIPGIGVSGHAFICNLLNTIPDYELVESTDICFLKGLQKIYHLNKRPTATEAKKIIKTWQKYKAIGNMFAFQACYYA